LSGAGAEDADCANVLALELKPRATTDPMTIVATLKTQLFFTKNPLFALNACRIASLAQKAIPARNTISIEISVFSWKTGAFTLALL
jgi:hypothetical protein